MRTPDIDTTFAAIRQLPLEVEFERIEQFVLQQPHLPVSSKINFKNCLNNTNVLVIAIIMSVLISFFLLNRSVQKSHSPVASNIIADDQISTPVKQEVAAVEKPALVKLKSPTPVVSKSPAPEKEVIFTDVKKTGALLNPVPNNLEPAPEDPHKGTIASVITPEEEEQEYNESNPPLRVRTFTSSYCNFDGEDAWIRAFLKALISDKIIRDTLDLRFTITGKSFKVNGNQMDELMVNKYNDLYQSVTNERLNDHSKISLSVGGTSCTLSKTINE